MRRSVRLDGLSAVALAVVLLAPLPVRAFDDAPFPHRRAEAERKAAFAERWFDQRMREDLDPNQQKYDVGFLELDLDFDVSAQNLTGTVRMTSTVTAGPITTVVVDLDDLLTVTGADVDGVATTWSHALDRVTVDLDRAYATGEEVRIGIDYVGPPDFGAGAFGFTSAEGNDLIWSLSEPYGARSWWPCKDTPADKADSASIKFTVPSNMIAVSNGTLEQVVDLGAKKRFEWFERHPITTYLISIAAYPYVEQTLQWQPLVGPLMPVTVWSYPSQAGAALSAANTTLAMLSAFESDFGPYPFADEKYGQAQFNWGGGMEHQTATSLCCWSSQGLIAHELGHQWYGDQVTCESFTEIWVNEGFATYSEALWREHNEGWAGYMDEMLAAQYFGNGTIRVPEADLWDFGRVFDSGLSYNKASWVLHMLRGVMGDTDFFAFLKAYSSDPLVTYGVANTDDVRRVAEAVSGLNLQAFFDQWIDQPWYPTYSVSWSSTPTVGGFDVGVDLAQLQTHHIYTMPVPIRIVTASGSSDHVIQSASPLDHAVFFSVEEPVDVLVDPDNWILHEQASSVGTPSFDQGILLVNGVDWSVYGNQITSAHADSVFTGQQSFDFWDLFPAPGGGYVPELPTPLGHGNVPASVLAQYSTVVWVGNNYNGDLSAWLDAPVLDYLNKGGNVLLLTRLGGSFLTSTLSTYLGVSSDSDATIGGLTATYAGLSDMTITSTQNLVTPLLPGFGQAETVELFRDSSNPSRVLGAWRQPTGGGSMRSSGGHFAYVAARPYRLDHTSLRANTEFILTSLFGEPWNPATATPPGASIARTEIVSTTPNPFNPRTRIRYRLAEAGRIGLRLYDARGRLVRVLLDERRPAGESALTWDGTDDHGRPVASGVYTVRLSSRDTDERRKITLIR